MNISNLRHLLNDAITAPIGTHDGPDNLPILYHAGLGRLYSATNDENPLEITPYVVHKQDGLHASKAMNRTASELQLARNDIMERC